MKWFKKALYCMCDEIEGAEHYAKMALELQHMDEDIADMYCKMAEQEMIHAMNNKAIAEKLLEKARKEENADLDKMRAIWDYESDKSIDWMKDVKMLISMYKE